MAERFLRQIFVDVAGFRIRDVKIRFRIDLPNPQGEIWIYNLASETHSQIESEGQGIVVSAGYPETVGVLVEGSVQDIDRFPVEGDQISYIVVQGFTAAYGSFSEPIHRFYEGDEIVRNIAGDFISDMGLEPGPMTHIPAHATVTDFEWALTPGVGLTVLLSHLDRPVSWYEDDGVIRFRAVGVAQPDGIQVTLGPDTGLIGSPGRKKDGRIQVQAMLDSRWHVGNRVDLRSAAIQGIHTITSVSHQGDNWDGKFVSGMELASEDLLRTASISGGFLPQDREYGPLGPWSTEQAGEAEPF